jgi:hypothetical protein
MADPLGRRWVGGHEQPHQLGEQWGETPRAPVQIGFVGEGLAQDPDDQCGDQEDGFIGGGITARPPPAISSSDPGEFATGSVLTPKLPASSSSSLRPGSRTSPERAAGRRRPGPSRLPTGPHTAKRNSSPQPNGTASTSALRRGQVPPPTGPTGPTLGEAMPDAPTPLTTIRLSKAQRARHDHHL